MRCSAPIRRPCTQAPPPRSKVPLPWPNSFLGRTQAFQPALVNGTVGAAAWSPGGRPPAVFTFTINNDKVTEIQLIGDPDHLRQLHLAIFNDT